MDKRTRRRVQKVRLSRKAPGFTLIEIMIVVAIIGLLAAIVVNRYTHALTIGQAGATETELKQIATALDTYNIDKGAYPAGGTVAPALFGGAGNQYMNSTPSDGPTSFTYTAPAAGVDYKVCGGRSVDGGNLVNALRTNGAHPSAGTSYVLCYSPTYGIFAQ